MKNRKTKNEVFKSEILKEKEELKEDTELLKDTENEIKKIKHRKKIQKSEIEVISLNMQSQITKQQKLTDDIIEQKDYVESQVSKISERLHFLVTQFKSEQEVAYNKIDELRHFKNSVIKDMDQIEDDIVYITEK